MSCNKADINPRSSCGHRHDNRGCATTSACQRRGAHFGVQRHVERPSLCQPYEAECRYAWEAPAPETLQEAIDRLAYHVANGLPGRISHVRDGCTGVNTSAPPEYVPPQQ